MIAFIYRAKRYTGTDKDSEVVLQKAGSDTTSHLRLSLLLNELSSGMAQIVTGAIQSHSSQCFPSCSQVWCGWLRGLEAIWVLWVPKDLWEQTMLPLSWWWRISPCRTNPGGAWLNDLPITVVSTPDLGEWNPQIFIFLENLNFSKFDKVLQKSILVSWRTLWLFLFLSEQQQWIYTHVHIYTHTWLVTLFEVWSLEKLSNLATLLFT